MSDTATNRAQVCSASIAVAERLGEMLQMPNVGSIRIPRADWTVGEAAAHLAFAQQAFVGVASGLPLHHGDGSKEGLAVANAQVLAELPERDPQVLARVIVEATRAFATASAGRDGSQRGHTPMGEMDLDTLACYLLAHTIMHGCGIARALHRPMPIGSDEVLLTIPFITAVLPAMVNKETTTALNACYLVHFRGGPKLAVTFDNGELSVSGQPPRSVDCHLSADPVAFMLVAMGIDNQYSQIVRGKLVTYGRKPWLALRLVSFLAVP